MARRRRRNPKSSLSDLLDKDFLWIIFAGGAWLAYLLITKNSTSSAQSSVSAGATNAVNSVTSALSPIVPGSAASGGWDD